MRHVVQVGPRQETRSARGLRDHALELALHCFVDTVGADSGGIVNRDRDGTRVLSFWAASGDEPPIWWGRGTAVERAFGTAGAVLDQASENALDCLRLTSAVAARFEHGVDEVGVIYAAFSTPLEGDGRGLSRNADSFASLAGLCLASSPLVAAAICAPSIDALTGLLNYAGLIDAFLDEVERSRRQRHRLSCCFIDLDGFKRVNDECGHLEGNQVLSAVGGALQRASRRYDLVARFGGDEFVVVLPETGRRGARTIAMRMQRSIRSAIATRRRFLVDASIGIATGTRALGVRAHRRRRRQPARRKRAGRGQIVDDTGANGSGVGLELIEKPHPTLAKARV